MRNVAAGRIHPSRRALTVRGEAVETTAAGGTTTGLSTLSSPGSVACAISNPGLVTGYARTRGDAPRAAICTGRASHDLSSLLLRAPAPARPACDPANPCTRRTHMEACHVPIHPPSPPRTASAADRTRHRNRASSPRAGGQFMVATGPATRRMRVVRVPTRAGGQRGRHGGRRRIPVQRRQQLFCTGLYQRRRAAWPAPATVGQGTSPAVALAPDGRAVTAWEGGPFNAPVIQASVRPPGGTWSAPVTVGTDARGPLIGIDRSGDAIIAWAGGTGTIHAASLPAGGSWTPGTPGPPITAAGWPSR